MVGMGGSTKDSHVTGRSLFSANGNITMSTVKTVLQLQVYYTIALHHSGYISDLRRL